MPFNLIEWEEKWIHSGKISKIQPFENPVERAAALMNEILDKR
jgi:hypothetical protein